MSHEPHQPTDEEIEGSRGFCATLGRRGTRSTLSPEIEDFGHLTKGATVAWVDYVIDDFEKDAVEAAGKAGFSEQLVKKLLLDVKGNYEDLDTELGILVPAVHVDGYEANVEPLLILLRNNLLLTIHTHRRTRFYQMRRYAEKYLRKLTKGNRTDMITLLLARIIEENNSWNFEQLLEIEERTEDLTMALKDDNEVQSGVGDQVYAMKHALMRYLSALWGTADTLSNLRYGDAELVSDKPEILERIVTLHNEVHQQLGLAENLSDVLATGLESLKSIYNNQLQDRNNQLQDLNNTLQSRNNLLQEKNNQLQDLNNALSERNNILSEHNNQLTAKNNRLTMLGAFLAILGAGFIVPNTIATVFSQTNIFVFSPSDAWWYLTLIVTSTAATLAIVYLWVKRIGLLPNISGDEAEE